MPRTSKEIFSENLRNKLFAKNKNQAQLAKFAGVSQTSVSHWVNGEIMPRPKMVDKICVFLNCSPDELMTDHSKPIEYAPEDVIAEQLHERPMLMRLMMFAMKLSDEEIDKLIKEIK